MKAFQGILFSLFVALALSVVPPSPFLDGKHIAKEFVRPLETPVGWTRGSEAAKDSKVTLQFALKQRNTDQLEEIFWEVSDPESSKYGKFLSIDQLTALVSPSEENLSRVYKWLEAAGIVHSEQEFEKALTPNKDFLTITVKAEAAENLLKTKFYNYHHESTRTNLVRSPGPYHIPELVDDCIDFIGGVVRLPKLSFAAKASTTTEKKSRQGGVTPQVISQVFGIPPNTYGSSKNNSQAVAQFLEQYFDAQDLATFLQNFNLPAQTITKLVGPNNENNPGIEAMLDIEYIIGVAPRIPTWFVSTGGNDNNGQERFLTWIVNMSSTPDAPWVHSVSYGDYENTVSYDYAKRCNIEFQKFGTRGRSILFASGDDGVGCNGNGTQFVPNFPATSPYVTAVGGVYYDGQNQLADSISSGGFSNYFSMPIYQKQAVQAYLKQNSNNLPPQSFWNISGRAFPDVASFSENVMIVYGGSQMPVAGTSCAAPVFSAIVSLINDARLNKNKSPMGFLNPFLYKTYNIFPGIFTDITQGSSNGDGSCPGFSAATGWDPITGLGTPKFKQLLKYAMASAK